MFPQKEMNHKSPIEYRDNLAAIFEKYFRAYHFLLEDN